MSEVDDRSAAAKAMSMASEILGVCFLMVVPAFAGSWLDKKLSTLLLFTILGLALGCSAAVLQLIKMMNADTFGSSPDPEKGAGEKNGDTKPGKDTSHESISDNRQN